MKEVAREAGVSISTVSRALNDQPFVREEVRDRVLSASKALSYRPDVAARSMRTGTTGAVGFVVSDISNPLFAAIAKAADETLSPRGYALMIANSAHDSAMKRRGDWPTELPISKRRFCSIVMYLVLMQTPFSQTTVPG